MTVTRRKAMILMAGTAAVTALAGKAVADDQTIVQVNIWNNGPDAVAAFGMSNRILIGTPGAAFTDSAPMGITANKYVVPAGEVEFVATNTSSFMEHEMLVVPIDSVKNPLPYDTSIERFDEDAAGALGEVHETAPGETGTVNLRLKPGTYMLVCNVANHYAMGMWTLITVV